MDNKKKYGIMGGTFDPIHMGHLFIAQSALKELMLDKVMFIPTGTPPHKKDKNITSSLDRYIMTTLAVNSNDDFCVSSIEVSKTEPSYTIDTVKELLELKKDVEFYFITGTDSFLSIETWKEYDELFKKITFVVVTRPGFTNQELDSKIEYFLTKYDAKVIKVLVPSLEISSTDIRERVINGKTIKYLVHEDVEKYINKNQLYLHNNNYTI
ncbi:nicotinate-nucleotide adenylyltransferase [Serpentinicella alkaliphila]|uniref:Probable nicotinate-nucleotide adenylyltransferase n=1 Tax=Serpentinicella alkaliphila TaxID=1734049 RepID=A0A4R2UCI9_9FIRM|nr:nicotinate-nucleotide adenylyltransferase [Serpentinicella alkaliphila]QUH26759.1 nicotinate-nucleotide adenylyltransferase [Serpentinicella alkaliphila]TCQ07979.1 nicotinate-nucleotide adenylyltransferase [Serpentinicella alkaliphila]